METPGFTRKDMYRRFLRAAHEVLEREVITEEYEPPMAEKVTKVSVQESLNRLTLCPICGAGLQMYVDIPMTRFCTCGEFVIVDIYSDGDVMFSFKMASQEKADNAPEPPLEVVHERP